MAANPTLRLLVVDNSTEHANAYINALRSSGLTLRSHILEAQEEAIDVLQRHNPDVILLDDEYTDWSLEDALALLNSSNVIAAIIVMSEAPQQTDIATIIDVGAHDCVAKQNVEHLQAVVKRELQTIKRFRQEQKLLKMHAESEARCRALIDSSRDAIAYIHQGMHIYANSAYLEMFKLGSFDDIEGLPIMDLVAPHKQDTFKHFLRNIDNDTHDKLELKTDLKNAVGETFTADLEFSRANIDGEPSTQITIRKPADDSDLEKQINLLSRLDPQTAFLNRPAFLKGCAGLIENIKNTNKRYSLLHIQIKNFKSIQTNVGLVGGDQLITEVANAIREVLSDTELAGRNEGSSYLVLSAIGEEKPLKDRIHSIHNAISQQEYRINQQTIRVECLTGASIIDDHLLDINEVMARTEKALTKAEQSQNKDFNIYHPEAGELTQKQIDAHWASQLKTALEEKRFHLLYQPIVQLDSNQLERYEVFMEMRDEDGKRVPPGEFLPAAERTKVSKLLDRWVITQALQQLLQRLKTHPNSVFFIKLTGGSLADNELFRWISDKIKSHNLQKWRVIFEVKEDAVISHLKQAQAFATLLKTIQCGFAIDDFGKGPDPF